MRASERESMSVAAGVWWQDVVGGMIRGLGGYCSGGASREASSCGGKGLCLFVSVRSVIEYTPLKVNLRTFGLRTRPLRGRFPRRSFPRPHALVELALRPRVVATPAK